MKPIGIIIHGEVGSGKTVKAGLLAEKAEKIGFRVRGVLSKRIMKNGETVGYNGVDLSTGEEFPLATISRSGLSQEWIRYNNLKYSFNTLGFQKANKILGEASKKIDEKTMIIVDEYGHLEIQGLGIYQGIKKVFNSMKKGGLIVVLCRTNRVDNLIQLFGNKKIRVFIFDTISQTFFDDIQEIIQENI